MKLTHILPAFAAVVACVFAPTASHAATIIDGGSVFSNPNWNTSQYGDVGYAFFDARQTGGIQFPGGALSGGNIGLTRIAGNGNAGATLDGPVAIQDGAGGTTKVGALYGTGITGGTFANVFSLTFDAGSPASARIGILVGASEFDSGAPKDFPFSIRLTQTTGIGTDQVVKAVTQQSVNQADWYFFNVAGISSGDKFTLAATPISGTSPNKFNPINGVAIGVIPEPTTFAMLLGGMGILTLFRRRR